MLISILIAIIIAALLVVILMLTKGSSKEKRNKMNTTIQKKGKNAVIKELEKKLTHDPHNVQALETLGELYFADENWEESFRIYNVLYDISAAHVEINIAKVALRIGIAAFHLQKFDEAINFLLLSVKKEPEVFNANFYLGRAFYEKGIFDKAIFCFRKSKVIAPESSEPNDFLALSYYKSKKYKEALPFLKKVLDEHPENKELLFYLAISMSECNINDKALKIFAHLRPDPQFGAQSCLEAGKMHERQKNYQAAIQDYSIALKLQNIPDQLLTQIKYRCASSYIAINDISKGLELLKQIQLVQSGYKDVDTLVARYQELNKNKNLQTYLMSGTSDFVALCRKFISAFYNNSFVKVEDVSVDSGHVEIICSIENQKWDTKEIFRFYRSQTVIGDMPIREFHSKMRDLRCDAGFCVTMGSFSESAHKHAEGRPIDLIEKDQLSKILKKINMFS